MSSKVTRLSKEDVDIILEVIEENKPPSRLRELLMFFSIGLGGGVGLGILIFYLRGV